MPRALPPWRSFNSPVFSASPAGSPEPQAHTGRVGLARPGIQHLAMVYLVMYSAGNATAASLWYLWHNICCRPLGNTEDRFLQGMKAVRLSDAFYPLGELYQLEGAESISNSLGHGFLVDSHCAQLAKRVFPRSSNKPPHLLERQRVSRS
jgi:hypothetical protein